MTINRTTLLDLPLPVTGTESGAWGNITNNGLSQYVDIAVAGMNALTSSDFTAGALTISNTLGTSAATNIAAGSAQYATIKVSSLAQNSTITAPASNRSYRIVNADSTYNLTIKASGQTGVTFLPGQTGVVAFTGTDYEVVGVVNAASSTDNAVPKFDGTTGQIIQNTGVTIDDSNNVSGVAQLNATTVDTTNIQVTNIKAKDGTSAGSIADSTGVVTLASSVLTTTDINGGTIDDTAIGGSTAAAGSFTTLNTSGAVVFNDAGADVDFRVESDTDANAFFVEGSSGNIGIGTSTITSLGINVKSVNLNATTGSGFVLKTNDSDAAYLYQTSAGLRVQTAIASPILFVTDNAERMRIDSSGNVGIGTSSPADTSTFGRAIDIQSAGGAAAYFRASGTNPDTEYFTVGYSPTAAYLYNRANSPMYFFTNATERARITSGGYFKSSDSGGYINAALFHEFTQTANSEGLQVRVTDASYSNTAFQIRASRNTTNNSFYYISCFNDGASNYRFRVADSGDATNVNNSYGAISDVKLKQDIVDAASQWDDIKNLRVRKFHWKSDPDGFLQIGLVAQEAELVSAGLIDEHPDYEEVEVPALDDEGNPVLNEDGTLQVTKERNALGTTTKSVKYSVLYMKAVKALQEAMERIETLEAKVAALEAK